MTLYDKTLPFVVAPAVAILALLAASVEDAAEAVDVHHNELAWVVYVVVPVALFETFAVVLAVED